MLLPLALFVLDGDRGAGALQFNKLTNQKKGDLARRLAWFYMLTSYLHAGKRTARLEPLDPFLHQCDSDYRYLFERSPAFRVLNKPGGLC